MLRKLINFIIPNKSEIFFELFIKSSKNIENSIKILIENINKNNNANSLITLNKQKYYALEIHNKIMLELNKQFVTPINREDIFHLSSLILKLTKSIININNKFLTCNILEKNVGNILINLKEMIPIISLFLSSLQKRNYPEIDLIIQKVYIFEEDMLHNLEKKLNSIENSKYKLIIFVQEIKETINNIINVCNFIMEIHIKEI